MVVRIKKSSHLVFACLTVLLIGLVFVRYAFSINIPGILLTAVIIAIAALGDRDEIIAISMCCIPLHEAIDFYISLAFCAMILAIKCYDRIRIGFLSILCIIMVIWELLHFFSPGSDLRLLITSLIPFAFLAIFVSCDVSKINYAFIIRSVAIVTVSMGLMLLLNCIANANFNVVLAIANLQRLGHLSEDQIISGGAIHPNSLGIINVLATTGLFQLSSINKQKKIDYLLIVLLVTIGVLTASRTFLVCLILMAFLLIIGQRGSVEKKIKLVAILIAFAALSLLLLYLFFPDLLEFYIGRFFVEDITTGRDDLMVDYHNFIISNGDVMFFGIGLNNLSEKVIDLYRVSFNAPHNGIQEIIVAWGIPGLLMLGLLILMMILESNKYVRRKNALNYSILLIILVKSMAGQILTSGYTLLALAFAYLSLCQDFSEDGDSVIQL